MVTRHDAPAELGSERMVSALSNAVPPFPIARFSVEQYHRMIESGAFTEDDRLELIEGWAKICCEHACRPGGTCATKHLSR